MKLLVVFIYNKQYWNQPKNNQATWQKLKENNDKPNENLPVK